MRATTDEDLFQHLGLEEPSDHVDRRIEMFARARAIEWRRRERRKRLLQVMAVAAIILISGLMVWRHQHPDPVQTAGQASDQQAPDQQGPELPASELSSSSHDVERPEVDRITEYRTAAASNIEARLPAAAPSPGQLPAAEPSLDRDVSELLESVKKLQSRLPEISPRLETERSLIRNRLRECLTQLESLEAEIKDRNARAIEDTRERQER